MVAAHVWVEPLVGALRHHACMPFVAELIEVQLFAE